MTPSPETARDLAESPSVRIRVHSEECFPPIKQKQQQSLSLGMHVQKERVFVSSKQGEVWSTKLVELGSSSLMM